MNTVKLTRAQQNAWRDEGTNKADKLICDLRAKNFSAEKYIDTLDTMIAASEYSFVHCSENFNEAGEYVSKDKQHLDDLCQEDLERLVGTAIKAAQVKKILEQEKAEFAMTDNQNIVRLSDHWLPVPDQKPVVTYPNGIVVHPELAYK